MSKNAEVDTWFADYESPLKDVMLRGRDVILEADTRIEECMKWKSPTFTFRGNIATSFNPRAKAHLSLMFHTGAHIPGDHACLEGGGDTARYMRFSSLEDLEVKKGDLQAVVRAWCDWKGE